MGDNSTNMESFENELFTDPLDTEESTEPAKQKKSGRSLWGLLSLLLLLGLGGVGYYLYQQEFRPVREAVNKLKGQLAGAKLDKVQSALDRQADAIADIKETQGVQKSLLQKNVIKLSSIDEKPGQVVSHSNLAEQELQSLLQIADDRLHLLGDVKTAQKILHAVLIRLEDSQALQPELTGLVQVDLKRLSEYKRFNPDQELFTLNALVASLQPPPEIERGEKQLSAPKLSAPDHPGSSGVSRLWHQFRHALSDRVTIVEYDQKLNAINNATINQYKLDFLKLRVETMRLMLIREDLAAFNNELVLTSQWVSNNLDDSQATRLTQEFNKLSNLTFPEIPRLRSIQAMPSDFQSKTNREEIQEPAVVEGQTEKTNIDYVSAGTNTHGEKPEAEVFSSINSDTLPQDSGHLGLPVLTTEKNALEQQE